MKKAHKRVEHTPTPWVAEFKEDFYDPRIDIRVAGEGGRRCCVDLHDEGEEGETDFKPDMQSRADAAFIVRAVNNHDKLVALVERACADRDDDVLMRDGTYALARALLEEVSGK